MVVEPTEEGSLVTDAAVYVYSQVRKDLVVQGVKFHLLAMEPDIVWYSQKLTRRSFACSAPPFRLVAKPDHIVREVPFEL